MIFKIKLRNVITKQVFCPNFFGIFTNPFYLARKGLYKNIKDLSVSIIGVVLDAGCGSKPYQCLFKTEKYVGMDIEQSGHDHNLENIDVFYDGKQFPFESDYFDSVLSNQVLEHVFNPDVYLSEIHRTLKKNGHFLITVPFLWDEHEQPYDYARYSSFGLKYLLESHGFQIIETRKSVNDIRAIFQMINVYIYKKTIWARKHYVHNLVTLILNAPFSILGEILNFILPSNDDLYLDNIIMAIKK